MNKKNLAIIISFALASPLAMSGEYLMKITTGDSFDFWRGVGETKGEWVDEGEIYSCGVFSDFDDSALPNTNYNQVRDCKQDQTREVVVEEYDPFTDTTRKKTSVEYQTIDTVDKRTVSVASTSWDDKGSPYNCSVPYVDSTKQFSYDELFLKENCSQDQESENEHVVEGNVEHTVTIDQTIAVVIESSENRDKSSCFTLLEQDGTLKNGNYPLNTGQHYCDMSGGGWTQIVNITSDSKSAGTFIKRSNWNGNSNYPGYGGDVLAWWIGQESIPTSYADKRVTVSSNGISWKDAKITINPLYWASVDGFNNVHGNAVNRDSINGMFVDGLALFSGNDFVKAYSSSDNSARRSQLGIANSQFKAGSGSDTFNYSKNSYSSSSFTLKAMSDQYWRDEEIGFNKFEIFVK